MYVINADAFEKALKELHFGRHEGPMLTFAEAEIYDAAIDKALAKLREFDHFETNFTTPVVRCKDCKYRHTHECLMYAEGTGWYEGPFGAGGTYEQIFDKTSDDGFCSKGERK